MSAVAGVFQPVRVKLERLIQACEDHPVQAGLNPTCDGRKRDSGSGLCSRAATEAQIRHGAMVKQDHMRFAILSFGCDSR